MLPEVLKSSVDERMLGSVARPRHTRLAGRRAKALRRQLTVSEARLWDGIKGKATGARFRRQVPIGTWIPDFVCLQPRLIVEVDDRSHDYRDESERTAYLESLGFTILRFTNKEIAQEVHDAIGTIEHWVQILREA